jgi:SAM-dependent methyltransferase
MSGNDTSEISTKASVKNFYDTFGWTQSEESSGEDKLFRTFPPGYDRYKQGSLSRTLNTFSGRSGTLMIVGVGDMPEAHMRLAQMFDKVICMDISEEAIKISTEKLGSHGQFLLGSIVDCDLPDAVADCLYCAHVVYHIDRTEQETAVRQMIRLVKPGGRIGIVYANPRTAFTLPGEIYRLIKRLSNSRKKKDAPPRLYYHAYPLHWWQRFRGMGMISFKPWEVIGSRPARALLRTKAIAKAFFKAAAAVENRYPTVAARLWQYPLVIIDKN